MHIENLIRMANQIGEFFDAMPDRKEAMGGVAEHLKKFWDPRMRRALLEHFDSAGPDGLHGIVVETIGGYREMLTPAARVA